MDAYLGTLFSCTKEYMPLLWGGETQTRNQTYKVTSMIQAYRIFRIEREHTVEVVRKQARRAVPSLMGMGFPWGKSGVTSWWNVMEMVGVLVHCVHLECSWPSGDFYIM